MSELYLWLGGLGAALLVIWQALARAKSKGRKEAESDAKKADQQNARDIRDRVERDLPSRLREFEGRGFRDGE